MQKLAIKIAISLVVVSLRFPSVPCFNLPGFSWGWGGEGRNYTKMITSPEIVHRYSLEYPFKQCSAGMEGVMTKLFVTPCIGDSRCLLTRGENVTLELEFMSNIPVGGLVGSLSVSFSRWFSPLTLGDPEDLCKSELISCPIQAFVPYRYKTTIYIRPTLPALRPDIQVLIKGDGNRDIACAIVPVAIMGLERENFYSRRVPTTDLMEPVI
ncbi:unnamed protein product [Orchesella dallaii]|uniref:MD-2-related lipid-recognition domain-containing protein n=1 Tax=Orchesella dallaii TaxID=48710 RepID=A0ABP1QDJ6_9HEXA